MTLHSEICSSMPRDLIGVNLCEILSNAPVNGDYNLMVLHATPTALQAEAGQFFHLECPGTAAGTPFLRRPMSIYRIDRDKGQIAFLYKVQGKGTHALAQLKAGEQLNALGPLGKGFTLPQDCRHVLAVGRGVGLATLGPLAQDAAARGAKITAILSARSPDLVMSQEEFTRFGARVLVVTDSDGTSDPVRMSAQIADLHAEDPFDYAATCGSNRLFKLLKSFTAAAGIAGEVALEARMGCGTGMCYACVAPMQNADGSIRYDRVCWDGPVFPFAEATQW